MKLIIQSDDFGVTNGVSYGTIDAILHGMITCTGVFVNTVEGHLLKQLMELQDHVCIGIDFNATCGKCVEHPGNIPHLTDTQGNFIKTKQRFTKEELEVLQSDIKSEIYLEVKAQYDKFLQLAGKKPEYLHEHAIGQEPFGYLEAIRRLSKETGVPFTLDMFETYHVQGMSSTLKNALQGKPYTIEWQLLNSSLDFFRMHGDELLAHEIAFLRVHAGFVDTDLLAISTYNMMRMKDHELVTSSYLKQWVQKQQIELISYRELLKEEFEV